MTNIPNLNINIMLLVLLLLLFGRLLIFFHFIPQKLFRLAKGKLPNNYTTTQPIKLLVNVVDLCVLELKCSILFTCWLFSSFHTSTHTHQYTKLTLMFMFVCLKDGFFFLFSFSLCCCCWGKNCPLPITSNNRKPKKKWQFSL